MNDTDIAARTERLLRAFAERSSDPQSLHDDVRALIDQIESLRQPVSAELRLADEALQAEMMEVLYDNLPI